MIHGTVSEPAPKDRNFLAKQRVLHYHYDGWRDTGERKWVEAFWHSGEGAKGLTGYRIWTGNPRSWTTESLNFNEWAELPQY